MGPDYLLVTKRGLSLWAASALDPLWPLGWMQHFITFLPKQIQLQNYWETDRFYWGFGRQSEKQKPSHFTSKFPLHIPHLPKLFSFKGQPPHLSSTLQPPPPLSLCSLCQFRECSSLSFRNFASSFLLFNTALNYEKASVLKVTILFIPSNEQQALRSVPVICSGVGSWNKKSILLSSPAPTTNLSLLHLIHWKHSWY